MNYRQHVLETAQRIAAHGIPTQVAHTTNIDLEDSNIHISGTDLSVQVCLHGDFAVYRPNRHEWPKLRYWDCPTLDDVIKRLKAEIELLKEGGA